ncbi:hypothetical protein SELMODRAFT_404054 [Selaginella moellendorffii]|uniref:Uncharacterized protein n=1 Tax=Selaginella moellendorffii TaxID=88036 RepID=D8QU49_SELML|nr:hypothetical protein SELMODRAFT_404054 [Selaginella moellendorffii]
MGPGSPLPLASSWDVDLPILAEPSARQLQEALGLDEFVAQPLPPLDRSLCDEFFTNFDHRSSMVRGERVVIDATSVSAATGLPIGDLEHDKISSTGAVLTKEERSALGVRCSMLIVKDHARCQGAHLSRILCPRPCSWRKCGGVEGDLHDAYGEARRPPRVLPFRAGGDAPRAGSIVQARYQDAVGGVPGKDDHPRRENEPQEEEHSRRVAHWDHQEQARTARSSSLGRGSQAWAATSSAITILSEDGGRDREPAKLREEIRLLRGYVERGRAIVASLKEQSKQGAITPQRKKIDQSFRKEGIAPFDEDVEMENAFPIFTAAASPILAATQSLKKILPQPTAKNSALL